MKFCEIVLWVIVSAVEVQGDAILMFSLPAHGACV